MQPASRVARNTGFLYGKMFFTIIISLYSTRLVLSALGEVDYGIFNLVAGVIAMLSFLNSAMAISTQRFLSFFIGAGDKDKMKSIFRSSVLLHLAIGLVIVILLEIGGIILFHGILNIPADRISTAKLIFHFMIISTFFTINAVPYDAAINAHENMFFDAFAGIIEAGLKLGIAFWVLRTKVDNLILYGLLIASLTIFIRFLKSFYCIRKYEECQVSVKSHLDFHLLKEMFSFAGWNLYGSFCSVVRNQGLAVVLNLFFGVVVNAAYGIANQVNGQISSFSTNMIRALYPQIVKSEGSGDRERMLRLSTLASKLSFLLFAFFAIPLIMEMSFVLKIWLKTVPENTVIFCQLVLVLSMIQQLTAGLMAAITSAGRIKVYQLVMGSLLLLNLPLAIALIKLGLPPYSVFAGSILIELIALASRVWLTQKLVGLNMLYYLKAVIMNATLSALMVFVLSMLPRLFMDEGMLRSFVSVLISLVTIVLFSINFVFNSYENQKIRELIQGVILRNRRQSIEII